MEQFNHGQKLPAVLMFLLDNGAVVKPVAFSTPWEGVELKI
jgi:hypothetical protein